MRLNTSTPTLFAVSSLFCFGSSLPFLSQRSPLLVPLVRRATYSVVPVDGGSVATDNGSPQATIVKTIIQTPAPVTVVQTDKVTVPPVTDVLISTQIIEGPKSTQTVLVTITHTPVASIATTTATKYSIIDVSSPPVTVVIPAPVPSVTPSSGSASYTSSKSASSSGKPTTSKSSYSISTSTPHSIIATSTSKPTTSTTTRSSRVIESMSSSQPTTIETYSTSISSVVVSTSTPAYDNGQWHTYYPTWSNATGTATKSAPTLKARFESP